MHIFQGSLVQKLNGLTTENRLFDFLDILLLFRRFSGGGGRGICSMRHLSPKVFRDRGRRRRKSRASTFTETFMQTIRLHRAGLLRQFTASTPGCANRLIHRSAVGEKSLGFVSCRTDTKRRLQCIAKTRVPLWSWPTTCSVRALRTLETSLVPLQNSKPARSPLPLQPNYKTQFRHVGNSIPWRGLHASMSFSNSCRVGLASSLLRRLLNGSVTRLGDTSSIWLRHEPSSSG